MKGMSSGRFFVHDYLMTYILYNPNYCRIMHLKYKQNKLKIKNIQ